MDINKCNIYFGNLKIKTGYFGQYKFYEDEKIPVTVITINDSQQFKYDYGISFLEIGTITNTSRALPIQKVNITGSVSFLEIGTETNTSRALPIEKANLTSSISFIEMGTETITTT